MRREHHGVASDKQPFVCNKCCHYSVDVCIVLAVSDVARIGQVSLSAYQAPIVVWGDQVS